MRVASFSGATQVLLAEDPVGNEVTRRFAEAASGEIDLVRFEEALGRDPEPRDLMRLHTHLLLAGKMDLVLAFLRSSIDEDDLLCEYADRASGRVAIRPDGALDEAEMDARLANCEVHELVTFQAHDATSGSIEEAVESFGVQAIVDNIWDEVRDQLRERRRAAKEVENDPPLLPPWATSDEGCRLAQAVRDSGFDSEHREALAAWLDAAGSALGTFVRAKGASLSLCDLRDYPGLRGAPRVRPESLSAAARTHPGAPPFGECDDRFFIHRDSTLLFVVDASGPTYGGYYLPIALDEAMMALTMGTSAAVEDDVVARLREGMRRAAAVHEEVGRELQKETAARRAAGSEPLEAAREASTALILSRLGRRTTSLAHTAASVTAIHVHEGRVAVAQIGSCRAFRVRGGAVEQLLPDHLLATQMNDPTIAETHPDVCTRLLGSPGAEVEYRDDDLSPGDVFVLLTDGAWRRIPPAAILAAVTAAPASPQVIVDALSAHVAASERDSATILVAVTTGA